MKLKARKCKDCGQAVVVVRDQYGRHIPLEPTRKSREPSHAAWINRKRKQVALNIAHPKTADVIPEDALLASQHRCGKAKK